MEQPSTKQPERINIPLSTSRESVGFQDIWDRGQGTAGRPGNHWRLKVKVKWSSTMGLRCRFSVARKQEREGAVSWAVWEALLETHPLSMPLLSTFSVSADNPGWEGGKIRGF